MFATYFEILGGNLLGGGFALAVALEYGEVLTLRSNKFQTLNSRAYEQKSICCSKPAIAEACALLNYTVAKTPPKKRWFLALDKCDKILLESNLVSKDVPNGEKG